jgi:hypothetical protein
VRPSSQRWISLRPASARSSERGASAARPSWTRRCGRWTNGWPGLDDHISTVRHTAATLFDLELVALPPAGRLVESTRFSYAFAAVPGQAEALAAAIRSHLPGALGRRRVAEHVADQVALLLDRQLGRARADFQDRLAETRRVLLRTSAARFDAGAGRIAEAVRRGGALRDELQWNCRHGAGGDGGPPRCNGNAVRAATPGRGA